jgi:hypothetical protein
MYDDITNTYYRLIGIIRLYSPTTNNFITTIEPAYGGGLKIRYLTGKQIHITDSIIESDTTPINV